MPAVNLPQQHAQGNVTLGSAPSGHLGLIINVSVATAGFLILLALRFATQTRESRGQSSRLAARVADPGFVGPVHWLSTVPEKSRVVSNHFAPAMSTNQAPEFSQLKGNEESERRFDGLGRKWSQEATNGAHDDDLSHTAAIGISVSRNVMSRPPPPPPLTPPKLATGTFAFEERRLSAAVSTMGELDASFFRQPNPDYTSFLDSSSSTSSALPLIHRSPTTPRRRSYTKMLPLGPPQPVSTLELDGSVTPFSPSSFPSSSPILPLAPHDSFSPKEIDVQGEIISVMDDSGAGWKRHTRVYGGGVCLACMASGEGGFYGDKVRPEERR